MLFTVNVETRDPPAVLTLANLAPGNGAQSTVFDPTVAEINWPNALPIDSATGAEVIPGSAEMALLIRYFSRVVAFVGVKQVVDLGYRDWAWPGHTEITKGMRVRYTVARIKPRLQCTDVDWHFELLDHLDRPAVTMTLQQRIYL